MKTSKYIIGIVLFSLTFVWSIDLSAKNKRVPKVYIFGVAASFSDSTIYFTDVQEIDSVWINDKNNFLLNRSDYSYQLKNYLESQGQSRRTCIVSYALKRKDLEKKYMKMRNKYVKKGYLDIRNIDSNEFKFTPVDLDE